MSKWRPLIEAGQHPQCRRLAAPARAEQREEFPGVYIEREMIDCGGRPKPFRDVDQPHRTPGA